VVCGLIFTNASSTAEIPASERLGSTSPPTPPPCKETLGQCFGHQVFCKMMMMMMIMMATTTTMTIKRDQERSQKYFKTQRPYNTNTFHVQCQSKSDTSTNTGNWSYLKITLKIPEQHTGRARNEGIGHCTHTSESTNIQVQKKVYHGINHCM